MQSIEGQLVDSAKMFQSFFFRLLFSVNIYFHFVNRFAVSYDVFNGRRLRKINNLRFYYGIVHDCNRIYYFLSIDFSSQIFCSKIG